MTVYQRVQAIGSWEIGLNPGRISPTLLSHLLPFSTIVVYPARGHVERLSDAHIMSKSLFAGVLLEPPGTDGTMAGAGLAWWLGDSDNKGGLIEGAITNSGASLSTWITSLCPAQLSVGSVISPGGTLTNTYQWVTRRQAIDSVCSAFGVEWRVNNDRTIDVGTTANLYGSTPVGITSSRGGATTDASLVGLGSMVTASFNYTDYASKVYVSGPAGMAVSGGPSGSYRGPDGTSATIVRLVDSQDTPAGSEGTVATNLVGLWSSASFQRDIKVSSPRMDLPLVLPVGSYFYLYAPEWGIFDPANAIRYEGAHITPVITRALGIKWPIVNTFGVYNRYWNGSSFSYDDISDAIEYESGTADIEVG